eukprot:TRINITY_DN612_c0_g1_i3.p1 TRINITY_DN612_c0_g1~~TRINITY_DN612_c0_g1_i3.p1  ORF type:complete len:925 (+),score=262.84 TRINITY_DN612_c0_g1_i3:168-2777(+)
MVSTGRGAAMFRTVSLRTVNVGLVVGCVITVALVCSLLTLHTSDQALDDTRLTCNDSLDVVLRMGEETVLKITDDYLGQLGDGTVRQLGSFWGIASEMVGSYCRRLHATPDSTLQSWDYIYGFRSEFHAVATSLHEVDGMSIITTKYQVMQLIESPITMGRGPDEYHHFHGVINTGTDFDSVTGIPAVQRSLQGDLVPGSGDLYGFPDMPLGSDPAECFGAVALFTNGSQFEPPCPYVLGDIHKVHYGHFNRTKMGTVYNPPLMSFSTHVGMLTQCDYGNQQTDDRYGLVLVGTDLRKVTLFLSTLELGELGRVFLVVRSNKWSTTGEQVGFLAGTSHGSPFKHVRDGAFYKMTQQEQLLPLAAVNSSDTLVAGAAQYLSMPVVSSTGTELRYEAVYKDKKPGYFQMKTNKSDATGFYVSVKVYDNGRGIDWYVVSLIDREYVLGEVDRVNTDARNQVQRNEETVQSDLDHSRLLMYLIIVVCALVPIALAVMLVFRITKPLMLLMQDMSHVAVMNLEAVDADRPPSMLSEVRGMEISFKQMLKNLVEYREYLPQSVLVESAPECDDDMRSESCPRSREDNVTSRSDHLSSTALSINESASRGLFDASVHNKHVTLLVSNIAGSHERRNQQCLSDLISSYLEPIVQHARKHRGIVDDISGDRVMVSFNTSVACSSHRTNALDLCMVLQSQWGSLHATVNAAIATGPALCGPMGCHGLKKYNVVGRVASDVRAMERCGRSWGIPAICDASVACDAKYRFLLRKLVQAKMKSGKDTVLHEVVSEKDLDGAEWMYQMQSSRANDVYRAYNAALSAVYEGDGEVAVKHLDDCTNVGNLDLLHALVKYCRENGTAPPPVDLHDTPSPFPPTYRG